MRRIALLLVLPLLAMPLLAQDEMEEDGCGCGCGCGEEEVDDLSPPEGSTAEKVEDKVGNFNLELPAGWSVGHEPQDQADVRLRLLATRETENIGEIMSIEVWRFTTSRAETFTVSTPGDVIEEIAREWKFFEKFYGTGSAKVVRPEVDDSNELGGTEKSAGFEFRSITLQEQEKIDKAMKLRGRGDKTVEVPEYEPIVIRGRIALLSPHIYLVVTNSRRDLADNEHVMAEAKKILDSWKFYEEGEKPGPLRVGPDVIENTTEDEANAKDRKETAMYTDKGRKSYNLRLNFVVPAGFARWAKGENGNRSVCLVAQDKANNWMSIGVYNQSWKALSERNKVPQDKKAVYEEWASNWEGKARGVKVPRKPQKFSMGKVRGAGYKQLVGNVEKFRGTFSAVLMDKSGFRTYIEIETRGFGDSVFADGLKKFTKSLKLKVVK